MPKVQLMLSELQPGLSSLTFNHHIQSLPLSITTQRKLDGKSLVWPIKPRESNAKRSAILAISVSNQQKTAHLSKENTNLSASMMPAMDGTEVGSSLTVRDTVMTSSLVTLRSILSRYATTLFQLLKSNWMLSLTTSQEASISITTRTPWTLWPRWKS